jgi:hypothetical protein
MHMDMLVYNWDTETRCGGCNNYIVVNSLNLKSDAVTSPAGISISYFVMCDACGKRNELPEVTNPHTTYIFCR